MTTEASNQPSDHDLDELLSSALKRDGVDPLDEAAARRVMARLSGPLPRQKFAFWRLPAVLLDWEFAPAWPRVAALATCAVLGFAIGMIGLDRQVDTSDAALAYVSRADLGPIVFEAEADPGRGVR